MPRMIEVEIDSLRVSLTNQQRIVVLRDKNSERYLPIWIGPYEAESITIALQEIEVARPQTHDLLKNILTTLNGRLIRVEVVALRDDVFFGNLVIEANGQLVDVDSRPSDAIALAIRAHVPILIARDVMERAGVIPEPDLQNEESAPQKTAESSEPHLSIFEDFLQKFDVDSENPGNKPAAPDEQKPDQDPDQPGPTGP